MNAWLRLAVACTSLGILALSLTERGAQAGGAELRAGIDTIVGEPDQTLVITVSDGDNPAIGRVCEPIQSEEFSLGPIGFTSIPDGDVCGSPTNLVSLAFGVWEVTGAVYDSLDDLPIKQVTASIEIDELVEIISLDGVALSIDTPGDSDCDRDVDSVDALQDLRQIASLPAANCVFGSGNLKCDDGLDAVDALFILRVVASLPVSLPGECPMSLAAPALMSPPDEHVAGFYPDPVQLDWAEVPGAIGYAVQVDCLHCCANQQYCADVGWGYPVFETMKASAFTFNPPSSNPFRWRVFALTETYALGAASEWRTFTIPVGP